MAKQTKSKRKRSEKDSTLVDDPDFSFFQSSSVGTETPRKTSRVNNRQAKPLELRGKTEDLKSRKRSRSGPRPNASGSADRVFSPAGAKPAAVCKNGTPRCASKTSERKKHDSVQEKNRKGCKKVRKLKTLKKKDFMNIVKRVKLIALQTVIQFVLSCVKPQLHLVEYKEREQVLASLILTGQLEVIVKTLLDKAIGLMTSCFKNQPTDRHPQYKIQFTFAIRDIIQNIKSSEVEWFKGNFPHTELDHFSCVLHSLGSAVYQFIQTQVIEIKELDLQKSKPKKQPNVQKGNAILPLLIVAGGCFGKIYNCVRRFIQKNRKSTDKKTVKRLEQYRSLKRLLWQCVMTPREKANDCLPAALKERDRGWLFIPKWVFLPYLRALDRSINVTANTDGLARYHKDLLKVTSITVESDKELKPLFLDTLHYIKDNFATDTSVFTNRFINWFFLWWQTKMVHSRVGQIISSHFNILAHKSGTMTKGGTTTRDDLYQVEKYCKKKKLEKRKEVNCNSK